MLLKIVIISLMLTISMCQLQRSTLDGEYQSITRYDDGAITLGGTSTPDQYQRTIGRASLPSSSSQQLPSSSSPTTSNSLDDPNSLLSALASLICRALHRYTISDRFSYFTNEKCRLVCQLTNGANYRHNLYDGSPCPQLLDKNHVCREGQCSIREHSAGIHHEINGYR